MDWQDEGIIIGARRLGEASLILDVMTRRHGRAAGLVRGGRSRRMQPLLQQGNAVSVTWRARLEDHLGTFQVEATRLRAAELMGTPASLQGLNLLTALLRLLAEREPHDKLCLRAEAVMAALDDPARAAPALVRFELAMLADCGFGLDLSGCAATGRPDGLGDDVLAYVSPRTGRAVSRGAGEPYRDRLLALPDFLLAEEGTEEKRPTHGVDDIRAGFTLTGHFLRRDLFAPRGLAMPAGRDAYLALLGA